MKQITLRCKSRHLYTKINTLEILIDIKANNAGHVGILPLRYSFIYFPLSCKTKTKNITLGFRTYD